MQTVFQQLWCGAWNSAFLTNSLLMPVPQVLDSTFISKALEDIMEYQLFALNTQNPYEYFNCKTHCYRCSEWTTENWKLLITQFSEMVNQTLVKFPARQSRNFLSCYTILHALYIKTVKKHALHLCEPKEGSRLRGLTFHLLSTGTVLSDDAIAQFFEIPCPQTPSLDSQLLR